MPLPGPIQLLRPHQWYKNLIVFVALVFSNNLSRSDLWVPALLVFAAFCLLSGGTYAWNDVLDAASDRLHPKKRHRPVASGRVHPVSALLLGTGAVVAGLLLLSQTNYPTLLLGGAFVLLQAFYNAFLRNQVIWDVIVVGVGFVLRALAGTTVLEVGNPTEWLILCTFLLALFLGFAKRRHELLLLDGSRTAKRRGVAARPTLGHYSVDLVEKMTNIVATLLLASYVLYSALGTTPWMMFTIPFAVYGVLRYLFLVHRADLGEEPELIFRDPQTLLNAAAWFLAVVLVLAGLPQRLLGWLEGL